MDTAFAIVNGTPLNELPEDLYIPPDALNVLLETFSGPLDLLLYLIRKQNLNVLDIPIALITEQYIAYIQLMETLNLSLAAEYLVMAAILAEIKSQLLLPRRVEIASEETDPRAELMRRLHEYEQIKEAAQRLDQLPRLERDLFRPNIDFSRIEVQPVFAEVTLPQVLSAFAQVLKRVDQFSHHAIIREPLSVRERMSRILQILNHSVDCVFSQLFSLSEGRSGVVVTFLALLELSKDGLIHLEQEHGEDQLRVAKI